MKQQKKDNKYKREISKFYLLTCLGFKHNICYYNINIYITNIIMKTPKQLRQLEHSKKILNQTYIYIFTNRSSSLSLGITESFGIDFIGSLLKDINIGHGLNI